MKLLWKACDFVVVRVGHNGMTECCGVLVVEERTLCGVIYADSIAFVATGTVKYTNMLILCMLKVLVPIESALVHVGSYARICPIKFTYGYSWQPN